MKTKHETIVHEHAEAKQMIITRKFNAPLALVWRTWTEAELLNRWWAPKPWKTETKSMDFSVGGRWLYSMNGPDGEKHWCKADYSMISTPDMFQATDAFCDEQGRELPDLPSMQWNVSFSPAESSTEVTVTITYPTQEIMRKIVEMGFKEGFTMAHSNLDALLEEALSERTHA